MTIEMWLKNKKRLSTTNLYDKLSKKKEKKKNKKKKKESNNNKI